MADLDVVIVTQDDPRVQLDNRDSSFAPIGPIENTLLWERRAADLQMVFDGATPDEMYPRAQGLRIIKEREIDDVFFAIDRLGNNRIRNLFFLGHGSAGQGFIFSGKASGPGALHNFAPRNSREHMFMTEADVIQDGQGTMNSTISLIRRIAQLLAERVNVIWFLSCFTGAGALPKAMSKQLDNFGAHDFIVVSYDDFYETGVDGQFGAKSGVSVTLNGTAHTVSVPRLNSFANWKDQIRDGATMKPVLTSSRGNGIPEAQRLHGVAQASVLIPLGVVQ